MEKNTWYVEHPTYRYVENVKALARKAGLVVVDTNATDSRDDAAQSPPALTLKPEFAPPAPAETPAPADTSKVAKR